MAKWILLIGGSLGFIIGCMWGNNIGASRGVRTIIMRNQVGSFFLGIILGFFIPLLAVVFSDWTSFFAFWLSSLLWTGALGFIFGLPAGYRLGRAFMINVSSNRTPNVRHTGPSSGPAIVGAVIGIAVYVFLLFKA
jgi:hypothetical protein